MENEVSYVAQAKDLLRQWSGSLKQEAKAAMKDPEQGELMTAKVPASFVDSLVGFEPDFGAFKNQKAASMDLRWEKLRLSIKDKEILHGISGSVSAGTMLALMGPSGAGKSSLLNVLAGRVVNSKQKKVSGEILVNGHVVKPRKFKKQIAYVLQEDNLFATSTSREALEFSARLRLPQGTSAATRKELVDNLISSLGLSKVENTMVGSELVRGLSGGEKKRVSIGIELVTQPSILFLDEPTSGLDSVAAMKVVKILNKLSRQVKTAVLCTIHQPSAEVFNEFDRTLMLSQGKVVYNGEVDAMPRIMDQLGFPFPTYTNPADYMMLILSSESGKLPYYNTDELLAEKDTAAAAADNDDDDDDEEEEEKDLGSASFRLADPKNLKRKKPGMWTQTVLLFEREAKNVFRDKTSLIAMIVITTFLNVLFGLIFMDAGDRGDPAWTLQGNFGALFLVLTSALFGASQAPLLTFPLERGFFLREYSTGTYGATPYFVSKLLVEIPKYLLQALISVVATYFLIGFNAEFFTFLGIVWLTMICASAYALVLGAAVNDANEAQQTAPAVLVPQLLFAGLFIPIEQIPTWLQPIQYICSLKYSTNLALIAEFSGDTSCGPACDALLSSNDVDPELGWLYALILAAIGVGFRMISLALLIKRAKNNNF